MISMAGRIRRTTPRKESTLVANDQQAFAGVPSHVLARLGAQT